MTVGAGESDPAALAAEVVAAINDRAPERLGALLDERSRVVTGRNAHVGAEAIQRWAAKDGLPSDLVIALGFDGAGTLWVATDQGLGRIVDGRASAVPLPGVESQPLVYALTPDGGELTRHDDGTKTVLATDAVGFAIAGEPG